MKLKGLKLNLAAPRICKSTIKEKTRNRRIPQERDYSFAANCRDKSRVKKKIRGKKEVFPTPKYGEDAFLP